MSESARDWAEVYLELCVRDAVETYGLSPDEVRAAVENALGTLDRDQPDCEVAV